MQSTLSTASTSAKQCRVRTMRTTGTSSFGRLQNLKHNSDRTITKQHLTLFSPHSFQCNRFSPSIVCELFRLMLCLLPKSAIIIIVVSRTRFGGALVYDSRCLCECASEVIVWQQFYAIKTVVVARLGVGTFCVRSHYTEYPNCVQMPNSGLA